MKKLLHRTVRFLVFFIVFGYAALMRFVVPPLLCTCHIPLSFIFAVLLLFAVSTAKIVKKIITLISSPSLFFFFVNFYFYGILLFICGWMVDCPVE